MRTLAILALACLLALSFFVGLAVGITFAASRPSPVTSASLPDVQARTEAPMAPVVLAPTDAASVQGARVAVPDGGASPSPTAVEQSSPPSVVSVSGVASWGPFSGHVVTRLPRGTAILVTGPLGAWTGLSWGYGPDPAIFPERIADLDRSVFALICGDPGRGICSVTLSW